MGNSCQVCLDFPLHVKSTEFELVPAKSRMQLVLRSIVKIQAVWRGYTVRKRTTLVKDRAHASRPTAPLPQKPLERRSPVTMENGLVYTGEWNVVGNLREGRGLQHWPDGAIYEGFWSRDKANGKGKMIHANGDVYEGQWVDDKAQGRGVYVHMDGSRYEGDWLADLQHGSGEEVWPDGSRYKGEYRRGKKHGYGEFLWADKSWYKGEFVENNIEGEGTYSWPNGCMCVRAETPPVWHSGVARQPNRQGATGCRGRSRVCHSYSGHWVDNKMHGAGTFRWPDNKEFVGIYVKDKKHGPGTLTLSDGTKFSGQWLNGKMQGLELTNGNRRNHRSPNQNLLKTR